jgi:hypothetical protein
LRSRILEPPLYGGPGAQEQDIEAGRLAACASARKGESIAFPPAVPGGRARARNVIQVTYWLAPVVYPLNFQPAEEAVMVHNVGGIDRIARVVAGLALIAWVVFGQGDVRWWGLLGIPLLATGFLRWCPAYLPFGIRTGGKD